MTTNLLITQYQVLTVKTHEELANGVKVHYKIISCPESVQSERYHRNAFKFNFGFVLKWIEDDSESENGDHFRSSPLAPLVKKLAQDMKDLELDHQWLSNIPVDEPNRVPDLLEIWQTILPLL